MSKHLTKTALLSTSKLTIGYHKGSHQEVLFDDLNLDLYAGHLICFMGPNGIGKSSLIRTLAGLQQPLHGKIIQAGEPFERPLPRTLAVVLTDRITAANLTVKELITFGRYPYLNWNLKLTAEDHQFINQSIEQLGISHLTGKKIYELSDGQMQMTMIARALAQNTPVILLDEPTSHLDLNNRVEIMNLLQKVAHEENKAILVATHELDLALQTADLIWLTGRNHDMLTGIPEDLVLDGSFDAIFRFKGFDLKTGKIRHTPYRNTMIHFIGQGHNHLWTKNALERNGYTVFETIAENAPVELSLLESNGKVSWILKANGQIISITTIRELLEQLLLI